MAEQTLRESTNALRPATWVFEVPAERFQTTCQRLTCTHTAAVFLEMKANCDPPHRQDNRQLVEWSLNRRKRPTIPNREVRRTICSDPGAAERFGISAAFWKLTVGTSQTWNTATYSMEPTCPSQRLVSKVPLRVECSISGKGMQYGDPYEVLISPKGWTTATANHAGISTSSLSPTLEQYRDGDYNVNVSVIVPRTILYVRITCYPMDSNEDSLDSMLGPLGRQHLSAEGSDDVRDDGRVAECKLISRDGQQFCVNRDVLAAQSSVFAAMFKREMKGQSSGQYFLEDVDGFFLEALNKFVYKRGPLELPSGSLPKLCETADQYKMDGLREHCEKLMIDALDVQNAVYYLILAKQRRLLDLKVAAAKFIENRGELLGK
ncbi:uncharacterized protein LOC129600980 [Paramacrobiotus metropolitanus]|uniref:uncharacterized protein LOC129600980 n=1 Tax=Paramacrobiotus metropolitanus TaxID=2943436 RepID=UPI002445A1DF|nr:uncharacterized protein LOC129600980 [Paramacrobiotus metropolitanus]